MVDQVLFCAFDHHFFHFVFSLLQWVLDQEFMEGTVFRCIFENALLFEHSHAYQIMKLHQIPAMRNSKDFGLIRQFFQFVMYDVIFNKKL